MSLAKENDLNSLAKISINYLFFGFYFFVISLIHVYHVFLIESEFTFSRYFFLSYAIIQCAIETLLLILFANAINIFFRTKAMAIYSIFVFFFLLTHVIDFPLVRFMGMSFWYALNFISAESPQNFLELLYASNVSLIIWIFSGLLGFGVLISGAFFYKITERWTNLRPFVVHYPLLAATLCTLCLFLMSWDYSTHKWTSCSQFDRYQKTLPWKSTFLHQGQEYLPLAHPLKAPQAQEERLEKGTSQVVALKRKPDIFLFVVESLREDYIDSVQAPNIYKFKQEHISFDLALANANATQNSWFSLFYSQYPFYWGQIHPEQWKGGSISLQLLKNIGYKIFCYSSARLGYYKMDQLIFGEQRYLADRLVTFEEDSDIPCVRDKKVMDMVTKEMKEQPGGRLFIVFLDSTHLDYSWPKDTPALFQPCDEKINYIKAAFTNSGLEKIKNRYRNALFFVDSLFGAFMNTLNSYKQGEEAVVIFTGDHGEEFYEQGHLFHASSLSHPQTHIPLYYKLGKSNAFEKKKHSAMSCHMDIFPTLFHYLTEEDCMIDVLQGQSIFRTNRWPYTIMARFNASRSPCEFCIHNGKEKLTATFSDERKIFNAKGIRILSTKNIHDEVVPHDVNSLKEQFGGALEHIFAP